MQTIMIDGSRYSSARELYHAIQKMLSLPEYFGMNVDALNDCLSERAQPVNLWILSRGSDDVSSAIALISRVFSDNGGIVKEL